MDRNLTFPIPEGFRAMSDEELSGLNHYSEKPEWCILDPDRHIMLSCARRKSGFAARLLKAKEVAKNMEKQIARSMKAYGYELTGFVSEELGGEVADGFVYTYTAQDIAMAGEALSLKKDNLFYYLYAYWRREGEDVRPVLKEIFRSFKWE